MLADLGILQGWQAIALAGLLGLTVVLAIVIYRLSSQKRSLLAALDHMPQGLCMYDGAERLVLRNKRYIEMYGFSPDVVKPG